MTCFRCKGSAKATFKTHAITLEECVIIIKNVPSLICDQCGEVYFTDDVMQNLENIVDSVSSLIKEVVIVEYTEKVA